ncbi:hypothetical protein O6H91_Y001200 [Diphasiastrum complanatum]|nr:hypothetical protein O6H91_Y001200 [Diphasiastrum complanatum]
MKAAAAGGGGVASLHRVLILDVELDAMEDRATSVCMNLLRLVESSESKSCTPSTPLPQLESSPSHSEDHHEVDFAAIRELLSRRLVDPPPQTSPAMNSSSSGSPVCLNSQPPAVDEAAMECQSIIAADVDDRTFSDALLIGHEEEGSLALAAEIASEVKQEIEEFEVKSKGAFDLRRHAVQHLLLTFEQIRKECLEHEDGLGPGEGDGEGRRRADLKAASIMKERGLWMNQQKVIGDVAGVNVGDCFSFRIQMCILGVHKQIRAGIDYILAKDSAFGVSVAISVVISTDEYYSDDMDMGETVVYTGQGGMVKGGKKLKIAEDQQLVRGNDGLKNSYKIHVPVRLIRGFKVKTGQSGVLYRYDGVYLVNDMKYEIGLAGNRVYKFLLQRMKNQPPLQIGPPDPPQPLSSATLAYPAPLASEKPLLQNETPLQFLEMSSANTQD